MVKLQEVDGRFFMTFPIDLVKEKGWKKGQELALGFDSNGNIIIKEIRVRAKEE